jgi:hypothetical protein
MNLRELSAILGLRREAIFFNSASKRCWKYTEMASVLTGHSDLCSGKNDLIYLRRLAFFRKARSLKNCSTLGCRLALIQSLTNPRAFLFGFVLGGLDARVQQKQTMKKLVIILMAVALHAHAQVVVNPGDVILAFRAYGNSQGVGTNLEVDLGSISHFTNPSGPLIAVDNLSLADVSQIYGANWSTRTDLFWGLFATDEASTVWLSNPSGSPAPQQGNLNSAAVSSMSLVYQGLNGAPWTQHSGQASAYPAADPRSYSSNETLNFLVWWGAFPAFPDSVVTGEESTIDFYQMCPGSGPGKLLGTFEMWTDRSGPNLGATLDFAAIPEPSAARLVGVGLVGLIGMTILRRRRLGRVQV